MHNGVSLVRHTQALAPPPVQLFQHASATACASHTELGGCCFNAHGTLGSCFAACPCGFGLCTVGFEIMPCLARRATAIARRFHLVEDDSLLRSSATEHPPPLHLVEGDMLKANLNDAGVVLLTSQCWDRQLIRRVHDKLAQELPDDALVVGTFYSRSLLAFI